MSITKRNSRPHSDIDVAAKEKKAIAILFYYTLIITNNSQRKLPTLLGLHLFKYVE